MKVGKQLGQCVVLYIVARVLIAILAGFVPAQVAGIFTKAADFIIICAFIVAIFSMLLGGHFGFMRRVKHTVNSLVVFGILIMAALAYFGGNHPAPAPINPAPAPTSTPSPTVKPSPTKEPVPAPTSEPVITPAPSQPTNPQPGPVPAPKQPQMNVFLMGEDNYNFSNSKASFGYGGSYSIPMERFRQIFTPVMAETLYPLYAPWGGSCFGFASTSSLFNRGSLTPAAYQSGAAMTYSLGLPKSNRKLLEFMELYQISQSLSSINETERASQMNYDGLINAMYNADGSVNRRGVLVAVKKPTVGHAVVAYDIQNAGNGVYYLSIYDNNYPNDTNRKMRVDTKNRAWKYDSYGGGDHVFRYLDTSVIYTNLQSALLNPTTNGGEGSMYIVVPTNGADIFIDGDPISEVESAFDATPLTGKEGGERMWYTYKAVYDIMVKGGGEGKQVTFVDEDSAIVVDVGKADAKLMGSMLDEGFVRVDMDGAFNVRLLHNDGKPVVVSGKSAESFAIHIKGGTLEMTGDGKFMVKQGLRQATVKLEQGVTATVDNTTLKPVAQLYIAMGLLAAALMATVAAVVIKKRR